MNQGTKQLFIQTGSLVAGFMVWVLISSLMPFIKEDINLSSTQIAWATAVPVILGSLLRIPIGFWANRYGARILFTISFIILLLPIAILSYANSIFMLILGGFMLGIGGAVFSIGVTSLPKYYPKAKHGFINGIYGAGNIGTAITSFSAPILASSFGWRTTIKIFLIIVLIFAIMNFLFGDKKEHKVNNSFSASFKQVYKNPKLWFLSLFYFITFGSFVAFTIYLPSFLVNHFELDKVDAGLRTAGFIALATFFRPVGGWLGDKINPFLILMAVFFSLTFAGFLLSFTPSLPIYSFGCLLVAFFAGIGNGAIFKLVPLYFSKQAGIVNGIVAAMGGLGGFFPPIILTILFNWTGHYAIGFMSLSEFSLASLVIVVWLYYQEKLDISAKIVNHAVDGICVTDVNGIIQSVNPAFTKITGFSQEEVVGKTPSVLQSGEHNNDFYKVMWDSLKSAGVWEGYIWNKRKNNEIYKEWLTITAIKDDTGETKNYVGMFNEEDKKSKKI
ncbi:nitrate/nitrite transporter [Neobacillus vireti]|uniref:Nitrite extrusion protein n=1 Tax=Neobacillus vireti LMG 21834 TaxID=1131730 RepID=A0AB94IH81_9BACI|nr:MFS transporter [Neobacillus vireti]ETI66474.1 nitrite extrusion protein [Neobacillus vireti LMG 21834]KLT17364.1 nitrate/nitrite transporter [Neobacillus vireti]